MAPDTMIEPSQSVIGQPIPATLPGLRQQALDCPQCRIALPDLSLGYCPSLAEAILIKLR